MKTERKNTLSRFLYRHGRKIKVSLAKNQQLPYWLKIAIGLSIWLISILILRNILYFLNNWVISILSVIIAYISVEFCNKIATLFVNSKNIGENEKIIYVISKEDLPTNAKKIEEISG